MRVRIATILVSAVAIAASAGTARAQGRPTPLIEAVVGSSGFVDEVWDYFLTVGAGARWFLGPKLAIGPEIVFMQGADDASNLTITGNFTFDIIRDEAGRHVVPYLVGGGGYLRQKTLVGGGPGSTTLEPFTSSEGTVSGGAGARIALGQRLYIAPEFRLGFEPTSRFTVMVGFRPGR